MSFKYVLMLFLGFQGYFKGFSRLSQGCLKGVSRVSQECLKGVSKMAQGYLKDDSRVFQVKCNMILGIYTGLYRLFYKMVALLFLQFIGKLKNNLNFGSERSSTNSESQ